MEHAGGQSVVLCTVGAGQMGCGWEGDRCGLQRRCRERGERMERRGKAQEGRERRDRRGSH